MKYEDLNEETRTAIHDEWNDFSYELAMNSENGRFSMMDIRKAFYAGIDSALKHLGGQPIYGITHRAYEFDDLGYPDLTPIKFYSTKEKRDNAFKELVSEKLAWFEKCKNSEYANAEDYEIGENTNDDFLELSMGKWCYEWGKREFEFVE